MSPTDQDTLTKGIEIKRTVGLFNGVTFIVGSIIGAGIFITPGEVLDRSGSVGLSLVLWAACGLLSILGALCYAELGTLIPKSGGEYIYFMDGFRPLHPFWGPLPAFMYSFISVFLLSPAGTAAVCFSCASYTVYPILSALGICQLDQGVEDWLLRLVAVLYLSLAVALNCYSIEWTLRVISVTTLGKLITIAIIIVCGIVRLCQGSTSYLSQGFEGSTRDVGTIATAFYSGLWPFYGWNSLNYLTEEVKNPSVTLPRAIIIGISIVICFYLAINVAYLAVLSPVEIVSSKAVAMDVGKAMLGPVAFIIPVTVVSAILGLLLGSFFQDSRRVFSSAREGHLPAFLSYIHVDSRTPFPGLLLTGLVTLVLILSKDLVGLIDLFSFVTWIFYVTSMVLILVLRKTRPDAPRPYRVPIAIPIIVAIVGSYLVVAPIISYPTTEYLYILVVILIGVILYVPFVYYRRSFNSIDGIGQVVQLTLKVGPTLKSVID